MGCTNIIRMEAQIHALLPSMESERRHMQNERGQIKTGFLNKYSKIRVSGKAITAPEPAIRADGEIPGAAAAPQALPERKCTFKKWWSFGITAQWPARVLSAS